MEKIREKLSYLAWYDVSEDKKIAFIENLYKLAYINYDNFMRKYWQNLCLS